MPKNHKQFQNTRTLRPRLVPIYVAKCEGCGHELYSATIFHCPRCGQDLSLVEKPFVRAPRKGQA